MPGALPRKRKVNELILSNSQTSSPGRCFRHAHPRGATTALTAASALFPSQSSAAASSLHMCTPQTRPGCDGDCGGGAKGPCGPAARRGGAGRWRPRPRTARRTAQRPLAARPKPAASRHSELAEPPGRILPDGNTCPGGQNDTLKWEQSHVCNYPN